MGPLERERRRERQADTRGPNETLAAASGPLWSKEAQTANKATIVLTSNCSRDVSVREHSLPENNENLTHLIAPRTISTPLASAIVGEASLHRRRLHEQPVNCLPVKLSIEIVIFCHH